MKTWLVIALAIEFLLAVAAASYGHMNQKGLRKASRDWHENRSPTTQAELNRQRRIDLTSRVNFGCVIFAYMAGLTVAIGFATGYWECKRNDQHVGSGRSP
jgi:hypothetical protein